MENFTNHGYLLAFGAKFLVIDQDSLQNFSKEIRISDILRLLRERKITLVNNIGMDLNLSNALNYES